MRFVLDRYGYLIWALPLLLLPSVARAEHFDIKLTAVAPDGSTKEAFADETPPIGGLNVRPVLRLQVGDTIAIQFIMTSVYTHGVVRNTGVHFYVVQQRELGQKAVPPLENLTYDGSFTFDLRAKSRVGVKERIVMSRAGVYLLRTESQRTQQGHEHFAAIDLEVR
jgi:hypothetical protein